MKQILAVVILIILVLGGIYFFGANKQTAVANTTFLRIHIRANSNAEQDQNVKYQVKERIVNHLTPLLTQGKTLEKAKIIVQNNLQIITTIAEECLKENGFNYGASASVKEELFPTRVYEDLTLQTGLYDALIVNLGQGSGDNWWCVVYPPLCFASGEGNNVVYKSKLMEIINDFKNKYFA